jgi:tetratricopeptide (TPR) repeat protein
MAARIAAADSALAREPDNVDFIVEAGLAREGPWRYNESIALYTRGLRIAPDDYRLWLNRAHRLIRLRAFDLALRDLDRAAELDPRGFNTAYLRALTYYLMGRFDEAAGEYRRCLDLAADTASPAQTANVPGDPRSCMVIATDPSSRISITAWQYRALRLAGRSDEAAALLATVSDTIRLDPSTSDSYAATTIRPNTNDHYYQTLLYYRGLRTEAELLAMPWGEQWSTVAYGVAIWHMLEGRRDRALELLREVVRQPYWARLGHVAAEADLIRLGERL